MEVVQNEEPDDANRMIIRTLTFSLYGYEPRIEQEHLILCELSDMNNVIIRPTGFGKSLIYQIAAMLSGGCYIIISPLKSLIRDQVNSMKKAKIECIQWSGEKGAADKRSLSDVNDIVLNDVKIIIATPEAIGIGKGTHDVLEHLVCISYVKRIVFDEAHCLVTWGRTFRDNYIKALQDMRRLCPIVPMSFYSATLTSADIQLIVQMSNMSQHNVQLWREPLRRPNIFLDVIRIKEVQIDVSEEDVVIIRDALVVVGHVLRVIPKLTLNSLIMLLDGDEPTISCDPPYFDNDYYGHYSALPKNMVAQLLLELMRRRYLLYTTSELEENDNYFDVMVVHWNAAQVTIDQSSVKPINDKNSRKSLPKGQIGKPVHQVDGMWQSDLEQTALNNP
uniref:Helicase ATP-binding domain-containing protein n=1 Tax=Trichogramma kaykai TaxID=54128 RepID=A0ABD2WQA8_9HYME